MPWSLRSAFLSLALLASAPAAGADPAPAAPLPPERQARGTFDVALTPQPTQPGAGEVVGRMLLDKKFHGPLEAVAKGQMLAFLDKAAGSGAYVAMEQVTGTLAGRKGGFVLVHKGEMTKAGQKLAITVAPGSATGDLAGLSGEMKIRIEGGKHHYLFTYRLP